jgi:NTP pyrophosphatase (non-canonical NTP hydrolase)
MEEKRLNSLRQLMVITAEECGELTQVCMKVIRRHSQITTLLTDEQYKQKLIEEAGDVLCMIELMVEHGLLTNKELATRVNVKREKLKTWSTLIND